MNKILLSAVAVLGFAGTALAQEVPAIYGNPDLTTTFRNEQTVDRDITPLHSATSTHQRSVPSTMTTGSGVDINSSYIYTGQ